MQLNFIQMLNQSKMDLIRSKISFHKTYYYSALLFAFTLPLSRAAISFFTIWFILLFIVQRNYKQAWIDMKNIPALKVFAAFISFLLISFLYSEDTATALNQIRLYGYWIIIPILALKLKKEWLNNIITAFLIGMFVSEIIAYGIFFELWTFKGRSPQYPSPFMSHIHYSLFLATTAIILLNRLLSHSYNLIQKLPILFFFLTSIGNLFISTGRTGQLAFLIAIFIGVIIHYRLNIKSFVLFFLISTTLFYSSYQMLPIFQKRIDQAVSDISKLQEGNFESSWGARAAFWIITYDILKKHPIVGVGIGDYALAAKAVLQENSHGFQPYIIRWCSSAHFHNQYLMTLVQSGLIGFGLMLWLFTALFKLPIKDKEIKELNILTLVVFAVSCIAEPMWNLQFPILLFVLFSSIFLAASKVNQND